jgi:hypothetical protein
MGGWRYWLTYSSGWVKLTAGSNDLKTKILSPTAHEQRLLSGTAVPTAGSVHTVNWAATAFFRMLSSSSFAFQQL